MTTDNIKMDFLTTIQYEMNIKLNNYVTQVIVKTI